MRFVTLTAIAALAAGSRSAVGVSSVNRCDRSTGIESEHVSSCASLARLRGGAAEVGGLSELKSWWAKKSEGLKVPSAPTRKDPAREKASSLMKARGLDKCEKAVSLLREAHKRNPEDVEVSMELADALNAVMRIKTNANALIIDGAPHSYLALTPPTLDVDVVHGRCSALAQHLHPAMRTKRCTPSSAHSAGTFSEASRRPSSSQHLVELILRSHCAHCDPIGRLARYSRQQEGVEESRYACPPEECAAPLSSGVGARPCDWTALQSLRSLRSLLSLRSRARPRGVLVRRSRCPPGDEALPLAKAAYDARPGDVKALAVYADAFMFSCSSKGIVKQALSGTAKEYKRVAN